ncbi:MULTISPECIES: hypothetical protein [Actinomadura]|uniref:hypothetical protein n=1 Tax=Actinomadura TaxID=1988 RepID=UPI00040560AC|nr:MULTISPECIES: hypothetical protein [Actinomadura]RSN70388.1 hypothetical protein DMH08_05910 [Actinomadura sp. WAC 06369]
MNDDRRSGRPNRRTADLLLSGSAPAGEHTALRELLDAAAAPARPADPAGEDAAAAAFTAAVRARPAAERPRHPVLRRFVTVKAVLVAVTIAVCGGAAIAAGTGNLPGQDEGADPSPAPRPARTEPAMPGRHPHPAAPPALSSPNARTSPPATPRRSAGRTPEGGRSASARPSARPSATPGRPEQSVPSAPSSPGRPKDLPTGRPENANPRGQEAQGGKPRQGPPAQSGGGRQDRAPSHSRN